jgi:hypothetical protein
MTPDAHDPRKADYAPAAIHPEPAVGSPSVRTAASRETRWPTVGDDRYRVCLDAEARHLAIRANCDRIVTRETPTHEYVTIASWSGAD